MVSRREVRILVVALFLFLNPAVLAGVENAGSASGIRTFTTKIGTDGGGINGELFVTVYQPDDGKEHPAFVMCPGSWEYGKGFEVYFAPFTPEFVASQGYTVVTWDPRGTFMLAAGWSKPGDLLERERYGIGRSTLCPPSILPFDSEYVIEDLYNVITYASELPGVNEDRMGIIGFSYGASYPIIERVALNDDRIDLIVAIEPLGDEASLISLVTSIIPVVGEYIPALVRQIPGVVFDVLWSFLRVFKTLGLPRHYLEDLDCDLMVVQSLRYHASLSGMLGIGTCVDPGVFVYDHAKNAPYRRFNRNEPNIDIDLERFDEYDWFPAPLWYDGDLLCEYFGECVEPRID
jgi:hypothetical protein